jgi:DNA-binding transcriptional LysR family regulator
MNTPLPMDMLITFLEIVESGSFSHAAKQVNRTQSAVSMQMKRLEEILKKSLFSREGRGSVLTPEGETLAGYARRIVRLNDEAINQLTQPNLSGLVKVGTPDDYATRFLPEILAGFSRIYPNVQVEVSVLSSYKLVHLIEKEKLDLALTTTKEPAFQNSLLLRHEPSVWVISPNHAVEEIRPIPLALFPTPDCLFRIWAIRELEKAGIDYRIAYTSESILGHIAAVSAGLAISVMSESIVPKSLKIITDNTVFPKLPHADIYLHRNQSANNPAIDSLADHIVKAFQYVHPT